MARKTSKDKWKAKKWFEIMAPKHFGEKVVGETPAKDPEMLVGRTVEVTASDVASGSRLNQVKLTFEINKVSGSSARTRLAGYDLARGYLRSLVRRRRKRIDLVKDFELDGRKIRVKGIIATMGKCYKRQQREIARIMDELVTSQVEENDLDGFMDKILKRDLQSELKEKARKVFPVAKAEIRKIEFLD